MAPQQFQFVLELDRAAPSGHREPLSKVALDGVDWQPALESVKWSDALRSPARPMMLGTSGATIEPEWDVQRGRPYVQGVRVRYTDSKSPSDGLLIPPVYFAAEAKAASQPLIKSGVLADGETFEYRLCAYPTQNRPAPTAVGLGESLQVEPVVEPLPLQDTRIEPFYERGTQHGSADDFMPVFIPQPVLDEAIELTHRAGAAETGGILIGHLHLDTERARIFLEVTAQIPATHAEQELTSLTFTPATWSAVAAAQQLRGRGEIYLGWWHSHPARQWCQKCPEEKRRRCKLTGEFFSDQDVAMHRCCFPRGYSIALVISDANATGLTTPLYGWHRGLVQKRGYYILRSQPHSQLERAVP